MKLSRSLSNPILKPTKNWWESKGVFNPGACLYRNEIFLLYRAWGEDNFSRFGLAKSKDGVRFSRLKDPLLEGETGNEFERLGIEDVRISQVDDTYYLVYTGASVYTTEYLKTHGEWARSLNHPLVPYRVRVSLTTTKDFKDFRHYGPVTTEFDSKDATLIPERIKGYYFLIHRHLPSIWLSFSTNLTHFQKGHQIMAPERSWEIQKIGAGSQPIKTDLGWLIFYHGVDRYQTYRLGAALLDLDNPAKVLKRTPEPIFEPTRSYEKEGNINNVVFTCGAVAKGDNYFIYYGAADKVVGLAKISQKALLQHLASLKRSI